MLARVVVFPGTNGDRDLYETLASVGFDVAYHDAREPLPPDTRLAGFPGGFSFGDYWRAGVLASRAPAVISLGRVIAAGGAAIGICNGFQILVEAGILPGALTYNQPPGFRHRWITVERVVCAPSPWFERVPVGTTLRIPMAHGEGNYVYPDGAAALKGRAPLRYTQNPNGSLQDIAAVLDDTGRVLGIMPHPERASDPDLGSADGRVLFESVYRALGDSA